MGHPPAPCSASRRQLLHERPKRSQGSWLQLWAIAMTRDAQLVPCLLAPETSTSKSSFSKTFCLPLLNPDCFSSDFLGGQGGEESNPSTHLSSVSCICKWDEGGQGHCTAWPKAEGGAFPSPGVGGREVEAGRCRQGRASARNFCLLR